MTRALLALWLTACAPNDRTVHEVKLAIEMQRTSSARVHGTVVGTSPVGDVFSFGRAGSDGRSLELRDSTGTLEISYDVLDRDAQIEEGDQLRVDLSLIKPAFLGTPSFDEIRVYPVATRVEHVESP